MILLYGILLFITHILSCIIVGFLFRFWKYNASETIVYKKFTTSSNNIVSFSTLGEVLSTSIMSAINTVIMIGGFVILFSVIISILNNSGILNILSTMFYPIFNMLNIDVSFIKPLISGIVELTNGLNSLTHISTKSFSTLITFASFILGFGGISVCLQVLSIISKSDISIKAYIIGKFLQGIISAFLTYSIIHIFPIFNLDILPIFSQNVNNVYSSFTLINSYNISILIIVVAICIFFSFNKRKYKKKLS